MTQIPFVTSKMNCYLATKEVLFYLSCTIAICLSGCEGAKSSANEHLWDDLFQAIGSSDVEVRREGATKLVDVAYELSQQASTMEQKTKMDLHLTKMVEIICNQDEDSEVRALVARSIGFFGRSAEDAVPQLIQLLVNEDEDAHVRSWVALILPEMAPVEKIAPAILVASQSKNEHVRATASLHLGNLKFDPDILLTWASEAIKDQSPHTRIAGVSVAARIAAESKNNAALDIVLQGASDADPSVQTIALMLLPIISPDFKDVKVALDKLLKHPEEIIRVRAACAVIATSKEPNEKLLEIILNALKASDANLRVTAAQALGIVGPKARIAVPALVQQLEDEVDEVRVEAAYSLARITEKPDDYITVIIESFASNDLKARMLAPIYLQLLVSRANKTIVQSLLLSKVNDEDSYVRSMAIGSLHCVAEPKVAIRVYSDALTDKSADVRVTALDALAQMGAEAKPALLKIVQAKNDSSENVRKAAQRAEMKVDVKVRREKVPGKAPG